MIIFKKIAALRKYLEAKRQEGSIGFVPTMGALHRGHLELISASRQENSLTSCSVFVNPTQFNDPQDFKKYPKTIEDDIRKLEQSGCDVLFLPEVDEIYPNGTAQSKHYDLGRLEDVLDGKYRPGHFQGVCNVVDILLSVTEPHRLYLGQKDYQQCMVIRKMIELTGKQVELRICPTIREEDGLAMSSRNMRLGEKEREIAPTLYNVLRITKEELAPGDLIPLRQRALKMIADAGFRPDYFEFANASTLELRDQWDGQEPLVALVAAFLGEVRLIDNLIVHGQ